MEQPPHTENEQIEEEKKCGTRHVPPRKESSRKKNMQLVLDQLSLLTDEQLNYLVANVGNFAALAEDESNSISKELLSQMQMSEESENSSVRDSMGIIEAQCRKEMKSAKLQKQLSKKKHRPPI